ncbi:MAG: Trk system potassium transporter TrkA [Myxococcales bacterium]|nr:Trk system potassium transporter TrkA [Myxococcales bacterium]
MFILVAGEDEVGFRIAEAVMSQNHVVFLAPDNLSSARLDRLDVEVVNGSCSSPDVLRRAHVNQADVFIACTPMDEQNIVSCLAAQRLGAKRAICFLNRHGFLNLADDDAALADSLGIDAVVRPAEQLAAEIVQIISIPGALDVRTFHDGKIRMLKYEIDPGAVITQRPLRDIDIPKGVNLVMGLRSGELFIPKGDTLFRAGDKVTAIGTAHGIRTLIFEYLRTKQHASETRRVTVVGGGVVGLAVTRGLEKSGWKVKVIEVDRARCDELALRVNSLVLHGDGTDLDLLDEERIADSSVLIAVTSNDEKNLLVSLLGKHLGIPRIITRADKMVNERLFEKVGIDVVLSARGAALRSVIREVMDSGREMLAEIEHGVVHVLELALPDNFRPLSLAELRPPTFAIVGAIIRDRRAVIPRGHHVLRGGDRVIVFCRTDDEERTRDFFLSQDRLIPRVEAR